MLKFFQKASFTSLFVILVYSLFSWFRPLFLDVEPQLFAGNANSPLFGLSGIILKNTTSTWAHLTLAYSALLGLFLMLYYFNTKLKITEDRNSYLPVFVYIMLLTPVETGLTPSLAAMPFVILFLYNLFDAISEERAPAQAFNTSFFLATASLFDFRFIFLYFTVVFASLWVRAYNWRESVLSVFGLLTPYLLQFYILFLFDLDFLQWKNSIIENLKGFSALELSKGDILYGGIVGFLSLAASIIASQRINFENNFRRDYFVIFLIFFANTVSIKLLTPWPIEETLPIFCLPLSFLFSKFLFQTQSRIWNESCFQVLFWSGLVVTLIR